MKTILACVISMMLFASNAMAATYYLATSGSDSNNGSMDQPWATFAKAFGSMSGGDTLVVRDGTYNQAIINPPSGSSGAYTKVTAENNFIPIIDGEGLAKAALTIDNGRHHIIIEGFHFKSGNSSGSSIAAKIGEDFNGDAAKSTDGASYIVIRHNVFQGRNQGQTSVYSSLFTISVSNNILVEENAAFGKTNKYTMWAYKSSNVTMRRNLVRWDAVNTATQGSGHPSASFTLYDSSNSILENNLALDGQHTSTTSTSGIYMAAHYIGCDNNQYLGNIVLNNLAVSAIALDPGANYTNPIRAWTCNNQVIGNNVAWDSNNGYGHGINLGQSGTGGPYMSGVTTTHNTVGNNRYGRGFTIHHNPTNNVISSNLIIGNSKGLNCSDSTVTLGESVLFNNNETITGTSGCLSSGSSYDKLTDPGLKYLTRIEVDSPAKGTGKGGGDIGANIVNRYQDGELTSTELWPWPNEAILKQKMCDDVGEKRGFCSATSITTYVWEYLGNPIPESIYARRSPPLAPVPTVRQIN